MLPECTVQILPRQRGCSASWKRLSERACGLDRAERAPSSPISNYRTFSNAAGNQTSQRSFELQGNGEPLLHATAPRAAADRLRLLQRRHLGGNRGNVRDPRPDRARPTSRSGRSDPGIPSRPVLQGQEHHPGTTSAGPQRKAARSALRRRAHDHSATPGAEFLRVGYWAATTTGSTIAHHLGSSAITVANQQNRL